MLTAEFYDSFVGRLVEDYRGGNARVEAALVFAREACGDCRSVLDVGCGIGWTTDELEAVGLDISPALIGEARLLFPERRFILADFARWEPERFDVVVLIDVYEHFPSVDRAAVHEVLRGTGARRIVLTVPTPEAQQYARDHGIPLQPIDEDVTDADLDQLAADVGGTVTVNRRVSIWRPNDYRHVLIQC